MRLNLRFRYAAAVVLGTMLLGGAALADDIKGDPEPQRTSLVEKQRRLRPEVAGVFKGPRSKTSGIRVFLSHKEEQGFTQIASVVSTADGAFRFEDLEPGEYLITPDVASLPEGFGLYRRHISVYVHPQPSGPIEFELGQIKKLELAPAGTITVAPDELFYVEAFAYDAQGAHLFAYSEIIPSGDLDVAEHSANGGRIKAKKDGRHVILARNGQIGASLTISCGE